MARVIVHEVYAHKLPNGSVFVVEPRKDEHGDDEVQTVKREVAEGLLRCGRGKLHRTDQKSTTDEGAD